MKHEQRRDLGKGLLFILAIPAVLIAGVLIYVCLRIPAGNVVVNEVGMPLAVGDTWQQEGLFALTLDEVSAVDWNTPLLTEEQRTTEAIRASRDQGYQLYDLRFTITNLDYPGYTDIYQPNKPFVEGLQFWLMATAYDEGGEALPLVMLNEQRRYPDTPLLAKQTVEANHCLVAAAPGMQRLDIEWTTNREARSEATKGPRPIYQKMFTYVAVKENPEQKALYDYAAIEEMRKTSEAVDLNDLAQLTQYAKELPVYEVQYDTYAQYCRISYRTALQQSGEVYILDLTKAMQDAVVLFAVLKDCQSIALNWVQPEYSYECELRIERGEMLSEIEKQGKAVIDVSDEAADRRYLEAVIRDMYWEPEIMREIHYDHMAGLDD